MGEKARKRSQGNVEKQYENQALISPTEREDKIIKKRVQKELEKLNKNERTKWKEAEIRQRILNAKKVSLMIKDAKAKEVKEQEQEKKEEEDVEEEDGYWI